MAATKTKPKQDQQSLPAKSQSRNVAKLDQDIARLEELARSCGLAQLSDQGGFAAAFTMGRNIRELREAINGDMMAEIMLLRGSTLGFRTDRDDPGCKHPPYPIAVVKDCVIECILRGGRLIGNEMNIIGGRCYLTKEFFTRMLAEMPGLTDLILMPGVPERAPKGDGALVPFSATWIYEGKRDRLDCRVQTLADGTKIDTRIPVRVNAGQIIDAIVGKAERKMRAKIYNRITGTTFTDSDVDDVIETTATQSSATAGGAGQSEEPARAPGDAIADRVAARSRRTSEEPSQDAAGDPGAQQDVQQPMERQDGETGQQYCLRVVSMAAEIQDVPTLAALHQTAQQEMEIEGITNLEWTVIDGTCVARMNELSDAE